MRRAKTARGGVLLGAALAGLLLPAGAAGLRAQSWVRGSVPDPGAAGAGAALCDPATGDRWELLRGRPGGPGQWIREAVPASSGRRAKPKPHAAPIVRAGDRLVIEEQTAEATLRLVVVALEPGSEGATLRVRPAIGGGVLRAVALGGRRAALAAGRWGQP